MTYKFIINYKTGDCSVGFSRSAGGAIRRVIKAELVLS